MDKMWSTWRSQYIESFTDKNKNDGCIFCTAKEEEPTDEKSLVIHKGKHCFIVMNLYPYNNGHLMVVPYRHTSDFLSFTEEEHVEIMNLLQLCLKALRIAGSPDGFNTGANLGQTGGAGIADHIHFHIVPRWKGDTNFMPIIGEVKVLSQDLMATKKKLLEALKELL